MRALLIFLIFCVPLFAGQAIVMGSGDTASYSLPASAPWTALGARRVDMLVEISGPICSSSGTLFQIGNSMRVGCVSSGVLGNRAGFATGISITGRTLFFLRNQFDPANTLKGVNSAGINLNPEIWTEMWDPDGAGYALDADALTDVETENVSGGNSLSPPPSGTITVHWIRVYDTLIQPGPSAPLPDKNEPSPILAWDFDGNTTESVGGYNISASGHSFVDTEINPTPQLSVPDQGMQNFFNAPTVRAGEEITLDGCASLTQADTTGKTYHWSDESGGSGPTAILFTSSLTECSVTAITPIFGPYTARLTVTDADARTAYRDFEIGSVAMDDNGVVVHPTDRIHLVLGSQIAFGRSPWTGFDDINEDIATWFAAHVPEDTWNNASAGTISVTNGSNIVTGTGTNFQADFCGGGTSPVSQNLGGAYVFVAWEGIERHRWHISSCDSATQMTMADPWPSAFTPGTKNYSKMLEPGLWYGSATNVGFYDGCMGFLSMYYRTGHSIYAAGAENHCGKWFSFPGLANGHCRLGPLGNNGCVGIRYASLAGIMLYAEYLEDQEAMWESLSDANLSRYNPGWCNDGFRGPGQDVRDEGYACLFVILQAALDPDPTRAATAAAAVVTAFNGDKSLNPDLFRHPTWGAYMVANGPGQTGTQLVEVVNGSNTVTCGTVASPLTNCGFSPTLLGRTFLTAPLATGDGYTDADHERRIIAQTSSTLTLDDEWDGPNRAGVNWRYSTLGYSPGQWYTQPFIQSMPLWALVTEYRRGGADYSDAMSEILEYFLDRAYREDTGGYVYFLSTYCQFPLLPLYPAVYEFQAACFYNNADLDGDEGGATASSSGTTVTITGDSLLSGSNLPGPGHFISILSTGETREIVSITDATHMEVASPFLHPVSSLAYDLWRNSEPNPGYDPRYLIQEPMGAIAEAYLIAAEKEHPRAAEFLALGDKVFGQTYGKYGGPQSDGIFAVEVFNITVGGGKWKNLGFGFGFGRAANWPAARLGGLAAEDVEAFAVPLNIGSVAMATKASVTLYEPKGTVSRTVNDQTGSNAVVNGDVRQGAHLAKIEYKDSGNSVLETDYFLVAAEYSGPAILSSGEYSELGARSY